MSGQAQVLERQIRRGIKKRTRQWSEELLRRSANGANASVLRPRLADTRECYALAAAIQHIRTEMQRGLNHLTLHLLGPHAEALTQQIARVVVFLDPQVP